MEKDEVPARFIEIDRWGGSVMRRLHDGWCAALDRDTLRCTIYAVRPRVCRDFEVGSSECLVERRLISVKRSVQETAIPIASAQSDTR